MLKKSPKTILCLFLLCCSPWVYGGGKRSVSTGRYGMVVSAQHLATQVGVKILKQGGNAVDAAVAMGYALAVVEPCCGNIGGGGFMLIYLADGTQTVVNFREKAPAGLKPSFLERGDKNPSYAAVGVPGTVKGFSAALHRYGSMPLNTLMQPAIQLAEKGFVLRTQDVQFLNMGIDAFRQQSNVAAIFLKRGRAYRVGERLVQKQLAQTLKSVAAHGEDAFYQGAIADALVKASQKNGGVLTHADLRRYQATFEKPLSCQYRGYQVLTTPAPSTGGIVLCELLNIMQGFPLKEYGYGSLASLGTNLEAIRHVYQDKRKYWSDPLFQPVSKPYFMSKEQAEEVRKKIRNRVFGSQQTNASVAESKRAESLNTTSFLVADSKGNWAAVTYTLNGPFGSQVIAGETGFFLNNELKDFVYGKEARYFLKQMGRNPDAPAANKRPGSFITQALLLSRQRPFLMLASPGGDTIPTQMLITIENFVDYRMGLKASINAPRYHFRWQKGAAYLEPEWVAQGRKTLLESAGYKIGKGSGTELALPYWGAMAAIYRNSRGSLEGAIDWRRPAGMAKGL